MELEFGVRRMNLGHLLFGSGLALALGASEAGCTYGYVTDSESGDNVGRASLVFDELDVSASHRGATSFEPDTNRTVTTWSATDPNSGGLDGLYYLNDHADKDAGDDKSLYVNPGWERIKVSKRGYDSAVFYRDHQYGDLCDTYTSLPYPDADYPVSLATVHATGTKTVCGRQDFTLSPSTSNYQKLPDLMVDPRSLMDRRITTTTDCKYKDDSGHERQFAKCLRVSVGTPNVGAGDLQVLGELNFWGHVVNVRQRIDLRNGGYVERSIPTQFQFEDAPGHHHFHFLNWTKLRLRRFDVTCPTDGWDACPELKTGRKISFCLEDIYTFESGIATGKKYNCNVARGTRAIAQGISVGMQDVYGKDVYGQVMDLSGIAAGTYWLEVEVNPEHIMSERDYTNNATRVQITIP